MVFRVWSCDICLENITVENNDDQYCSNGHQMKIYQTYFVEKTPANQTKTKKILKEIGL